MMLKKMRESGCRLWDGAMGPMLMRAGLEAGVAPENWNIDRPEQVRTVYEDYFAQGATVVQTNTFGGNRARLGAARSPYSVEEVNRAAVTLAREARPADGYVAGAVGPTGMVTPSRPAVDPKLLQDIFAEQMTVLAEHQVDLLSVETMYDRGEAQAAIAAAGKFLDLPLVVSLTLRATSEGFLTPMGDRAWPTLQSFIDLGADCVGVNCFVPSEETERLPGELRNQIPGLLILRPNAGLPTVKTAAQSPRARSVEERREALWGPKRFADFLGKAVDCGIDFVGGCCGTTPGHIGQLAQRCT